MWAIWGQGEQTHLTSAFPDVELTVLQRLRHICCNEYVPLRADLCPDSSRKEVGADHPLSVCVCAKLKQNETVMANGELKKERTATISYGSGMLSALQVDKVHMALSKIEIGKVSENPSVLLPDSPQKNLPQLISQLLTEFRHARIELNR